MGLSAATLAVAAVGTGYSIYSQERAAKEAERARNVKPPELPKQPKIASFATDQQKAQALAMSAGGTIFSNQRDNRRIGTDNLQQRKTLLGS